jgi:hypothetical protein
VEVEAVPASRLTGESGTALASALLPHWPGQRDVSGLGNEAIARQESSKLSRWEPEYDTYLVVRRANLLAYVHYGRWSPPSKAEMDRDALRLAKKILAAYPS